MRKAFDVFGIICAALNFFDAIRIENYHAMFGWLAALCFSLTLFLKDKKC